MKLSEDTLAKPTQFHVMRGADDQFEHRAQVIRLACDLELLLTDNCLRWLGEHNPNLDHAAARKEFFEEGPIGSLKKLADLAYFTGSIGPKTRHDLRKFASLRDRYAHDRERKQLSDDPEMFALLTATYTFRDNRELLQGEYHTATLLRVFWHLHEVVESRHLE